MVAEVPGDIVHVVNEGLVPDRVEGLGLGGRAVQVLLVGVDRHVRVYRLVVCNRTPYLHDTPTPILVNIQRPTSSHNNNTTKHV